jgi:hypothetical protein
MNKALIIAALSEMSRPELTATAKRIGVPVGKSKANTINNVADAIAGVKGARCTIDLTIRKGESSSVSGEVITAVKFRSARKGDLLRSAVNPTAPAAFGVI